MNPESQKRLQELATEMVRILGIRQGQVEIPCYDGVPKALTVVDKSIHFGAVHVSECVDFSARSPVP